MTDFNDFTQEDRDRYYRKVWWWQTLRTLRSEWVRSTVGDFDTYFDTWVLDTHGITVLRDRQGNILDEYTISDEKKHLVFILKYR
jgi:hypothetical protein